MHMSASMRERPLPYTNHSTA